MKEGARPAGCASFWLPAASKGGHISATLSYAVPVNLPQTPPSLARLITRLVWASLALFTVSEGLSFMTPGSGGVNSPILGLVFALTMTLVMLPLLFLAAAHVLAWLNRVAAWQASATDLTRVTVWIDVFRLVAGLGLVSGVIWAGFLILTAQIAVGKTPPLTWWSIAVLIASSVGSFNLLGVAREWVRLHTASQGDITSRSRALLPLLPNLTGWVRALQVLSVLSMVQSLVAGTLSSLGGLTAFITLILSIVILEFTLRFAQVSARPGPETRGHTPA